MELNTERLNLFPAEIEHLMILMNMWNDPVVRKYLWDDTLVCPQQVEEILITNENLFRENQTGLWLIKLRDTGEIIGFTGLWSFFDESQPQLLYGLLPQFFGQGYAAEASARIIEYSFVSLGFSYLDAACDLPNTASVRVAQRLGMKKIREENLDGKPTVFFRIENNSTTFHQED